MMSSSYSVADLAVINYGQVLRRDPKECRALLEACERWGFFYLDLRQNDDCVTYFALTQDLLDFSKHYFSQSLEKKLYDRKEDFATFNICG
jgi:isopenicillin N synthase-like dioxygenase